MLLAEKILPACAYTADTRLQLRGPPVFSVANAPGSISQSICSAQPCVCVALEPPPRLTPMPVLVPLDDPLLQLLLLLPPPLPSLE